MPPEPTPQPTPTPAPVPPPPPDPTPTQATTPPPEIVYSAEQRVDIDRKIASARRTAEAEARRTLDAAAVTAKAEADAAAKLKADEERGEYEAAKTTLTGERDAAAAEAKAATDRIAAYETALTPAIDAIKADLPAEALTDYQADAPAIERLTWLQTRATLVASLAPAKGAPRIGLTPRPNRQDVPDKITSPVTQKQITG